MPGRHRKPTARHRVAGTARPDRLNPTEPTYAPAAPDKPAAVAEMPDASTEWDRIVPIMLEQRVITEAYRAALEDLLPGIHRNGAAGARLHVDDQEAD